MRSRCVPLLAAAAFCAGSLIVSHAQETGKPPDTKTPASDSKPDPATAGPLEVWIAEAHVRLEVFALSQDLARQAQRQFPKQADLYAWLVTEMEKPEAAVKLERMDVLRIRSGQRSNIEGIDEYPYPTEYDPPQIPQTIGIGMPATIKPDISGAPQVPGPPAPVVPPAPQPDSAAVPGSAGAKGDAHSPGSPGSPGTNDLPSAFPKPGPQGSVPARAVPPWPYTQTTPTAYATRNTGWTCEMELTMSADRKSADVNVRPGFCKPAGIEALMINAEEEAPRFEVRTVETTLRALVGKPTLAGTFSRPVNTGAGGSDKDGAARLLFLTVSPATTPPQVVPGAYAADPFAAPENEKEKSGEAQPVPEALLRLEAISLPFAAARKALISNPWETQLYAWLDSELSRKDSGVSLEHTSTLRVRSGQRAKSGANMEFPYGTEFDPPQIPQSISLPRGLTAIPIPGTESVFTPWPTTMTTTSAIATKILGWTSEAEVTFGEDRRVVDLNLDVQQVRIVGKLLYGSNKDIMQPVFETQKFHGQTITVIGRPTLISTFTPPTGTEIPGANTSDRVWFLFGTVTLAE